jgi:lipopolysaccharide/colanic/teichoic acid biosynthesis glycosyltransferase
LLSSPFDSARVVDARNTGYRFCKPLFDIAIILLTIPASLPLCILIALAIGVTMGRPIFYRQERLGKDGVVFWMWKFRTMRNEPEGLPVTAVNDARITPLGGFLRRAHVDELPQLVNVLLGHMSLVGPRPEQPVLARDYTLILPAFEHRLLVPAGMTGWAQINAPYAGNFSQSEFKLSFDLYYMIHRSLALDSEILARTAWYMLTFLFKR